MLNKTKLNGTTMFPIEDLDKDKLSKITNSNQRVTPEIKIARMLKSMYMLQDLNRDRHRDIGLIQVQINKTNGKISTLKSDIKKAFRLFYDDILPNLREDELNRKFELREK